jgi:hypothetical protein
VTIQRRRGCQDRCRINTSVDYEVRYWSKKFGVSADYKAALKTPWASRLPNNQQQ